VPGLGVKTVDKLVAARRWSRIRLHDLTRLRLSLKKLLPFIETADYSPRPHELEDANLRARFVAPPDQLELFTAAGSTLTNEF
jgi:predicted DNA-binding helix-hairpin-helix protein